MVVGGTGMVGRNVVTKLQERGHEVIAAAPQTGFNTLTGEGVDATLEGAEVVLDVTNAPNMEEGPATDFFRTSGRTLLAAEKKAGVRHHVTLSIVGVDRPHDLGYYRAKVAQEQVVRDGDVPFTIVRSTQFFEFMKAVVDGNADGNTVRLPTTMVQPIAVTDLAAELASIAVEAPVGDVVEVAGPEAMPLDEFARRLTAVIGDGRTVTTDPSVRPFFGVELDGRLLVPGPGARLAATDLPAWVAA
ncbi:SDR family oxidoreductase [Micromonospora sp. CPCC 205556]|uniref:SDR family oxidoreductase n=1 Tax=Micromonospora sp. CPCC 205556 TaxID=3122398 RepID=UPI002FF22EFB